jgi:hypothetical protein
MTTTSTVSTTSVELAWEITGLVSDSAGTITRAYWCLRGRLGQEGSDHIYTDAVYGDTDMTRGDAFTEFDQVTEQQVGSWIAAILGGAEMQRLTTQVSSMVNNQRYGRHNVEFARLPWSSQ